MPKFLKTTGVSHHLEELINGTKEQLVLISPYLQLHRIVKDNIHNLTIQKCDIRIVYRENKLQIDESQWLEEHIGIRTSILSSLHAKCYLNEKEVIVTSMNLYSFSQQNNDEMGILVKKEEDPDLYNSISEEVKRLLTISKEIRISIKKVVNSNSEDIIESIENNTNYSKTNYKTTKELSEETGISSRKINSWLVDNKLMYKKDDDWFATKKGKEIGGILKEGQYGKFVVWPEEIAREIDT